MKRIIAINLNKKPNKSFKVLSTLGGNPCIFVEPTFFNDDLTTNFFHEEVLRNTELMAEFAIVLDDAKINKKNKNNLDYLKSIEPEKLYDEFNYIQLAGSKKQIINFILEHRPLYQNKNLILDRAYNLTDEGYLEAVTDINDIKKITGIKEIEVIVEEDISSATLEEFYQALKYKNDIISLVSSLDLSPLEKAMIVYDIIKQRHYAIEEENESFTKSRDLIPSLIGDKIVCVGFVKILKTIFDKLGFEGIDYELDSLDDDVKHIRYLAKIEDSKYQVSGIYQFDPTWDSFATIQKNPVNMYLFFAKSFDEAMKIDKEVGVISKFIKNKARNVLEKNSSCIDTIEFLNPYLLLCGREILTLNNFEDRSNQAYREVLEDMGHPIELTTFASLLLNVRKIEYYLNPELFPMDVLDLKKSFYTNKFTGVFSWKLIEDASRAELEPYQYANILFNKIWSKVFDEETLKEIEGLKLTRTLRSALINKQQ